MTREDINQLLRRYNKEIVAESLRGRVELSLDVYDGEYVMFSLLVDGNIYKFFSFEEIIGYDFSQYLYDVRASLQTRYENMLSVPIEKRDVYTGQELLSALKGYFAVNPPDGIDLGNPLSLMLYILDKRSDISLIEEKEIRHKWLADIYRLRLTGSMPKEFYERKTVALNFTSCNDLGDIYREMRIKMKWFLYYGESLDALHDILTGMYYYGDDFIIKRKRVYRFTEYGRGIDYTNKIDKLCELFKEAAENKYSNITVKIEYVD